MNDSQSHKKLKRSELEDLVKELSDSVREKQDQLSCEKSINSLFNRAIFENNANGLIEEFFEDLALKETSSIRLIFLKKDYFLQKFYFSDGKNSEDFGLLDEQIAQQVGEKNQLIVQDTSRIHNIRFFQGYSYPRSLIAFPILQSNEKIGLVWIGDLDYQAFSKQEFEHYERVIEKFQGVFAVLLEKEILEKERHTLNRIVYNDEPPIIIFNCDQKIFYANELAVNQFDLVENENEEYISSNIDFYAVFQSFDTLDRSTIQYKEKEYEVNVFKITENSINEAICCRFIDKTFEFAKNKYFATIISTITQYLRTPMIEIKGLTSLISALGNLSDKQLEFLSQIQNNVSEIENNIARLLSINRIDKDGFVELSKFSVEECVNNVIKIFLPLAEQKQITIKSTIDEKKETVISDKILLKHALLNVLEYAIKETHMGGTIDIDHKIDAEYHSIAITDSGKGISKLDVKNMMEKKNTDKDRDELEIAKDIISILNGGLVIESNLGSGATITLRFPRNI